MADEHSKEHQGVRPRAKGRNRPTGGLQGRMRALGAASSARDADLRDPRRDCEHALNDEGEVHCTCRAFLAGMGVSTARCIGSRCGYAVLPRPKEERDGT